MNQRRFARLALFAALLVTRAAFSAGLPAACGPDVATPPGLAGPVAITDQVALAAKTDAIFSTVAMSPAMVKADQQSGITAFYMNDEQREHRRFVIIDGKTYYGDGRTLEQTANAFGDQMNYVMDAAGNFYLFDENTCHVIRHGSIFDGAPIAGAGDIQIENGQIVKINSNSGHYPTHPLFMTQVIPILQKMGAAPKFK